jgi:hypothetical protein
MALIDMQLDRKEAQEEVGASLRSDNLPKYPYGLCIYLDDETLEKLGLTQLPKVGTTLQLMAMVKVTGTRSHEIQTEKESGEPEENTSSSVDMQITAMELSAGQTQQSAASMLYGG